MEDDSSDRFSLSISSSEPSAGEKSELESEPQVESDEENIDRKKESDAAEAKTCRNIHQAASQGKIGAVRHFLTVDPESLERRDTWGKRPLHFAADRNHIDVVRLLLAAKATMNNSDKTGQRPLHCASEEGHSAVVEELLASKATAHVADDVGGTPLHGAVVKNNLGIVQRLLVANAVVNAANRSGRTPLHTAARNGSSEVVQKLLGARSNPNAAGQDGKLPVHHAAENRHNAIFKKLIAITNSYKTLQFAIESRNIALLKYLLAAEANPQGSHKGETPLHLAVTKGLSATAIVKELIACGASPKQRNAEGKTALDVARRKGYAEMEGFLYPVSVLLLSGRKCLCDSTNERTIGQLRQEAAQELGCKIGHLVTRGRQILCEDMTLKTAGISPGDAVTAIIPAEEEEEEDEPEEEEKLAFAWNTAQLLKEQIVEVQCCGIMLKMRQSIYEEISLGVEILEEWSDLRNSSSLPDVLPPDHQVLSPLIRLTPEDVIFPAPIEVEVPTCAGAKTAWRSTPTGWEQLETSCGEGHVLLELRHFCDLFVTGRCAIRAMGFVKPEEPAAKIAVLHVGCDECLSVLNDQYCKDDAFLKGFNSYGPPAALGSYKAEEIISMVVPDAPPVELKLKFHRFPLVSRHFAIPNPTSFLVEIDDEQFTFEEASSTPASSSAVSPRPNAAVSSTPASSSAVSPTPNAAVSSTPASSNAVSPRPNAAVSSTPASSNAVSPRPNAAVPSTAISSSGAASTSGAARRAADDRRARRRLNHGYQLQPSHVIQQANSPPASVSRADGTAMPLVVQPAAYPVATPRSRGHLLLSGRFKGDDFFTAQQIMDYMKLVRDYLVSFGVPAYMVEAKPGDDFAEMTRVGLGYAKGMVNFCTSEYGAYTGVGYETFRELQNAFDRELPLFPIKLCREWPPKPRDPRDGGRGVLQNQLVFNNGLVYIEDLEMQNAQGVASQIAEAVLSRGLF